MKIDLKGKWTMSSTRYHGVETNVPGSVLGALLDHKLIEDPYYRLNESEVRKVSFEDFDFERDFSLTKEQLKKHNFLFLDGLDTVPQVYINDHLVAESRSMNIAQRILLNPSFLKEENRIKIHFVSPYRYIEEYPQKDYFHTYSYNVTQEKSPVIRKANSMFGWDWGPNLGDMGIFRDIYILSTEIGHFECFSHKQEFLPGGKARITVRTHYRKLSQGKLTLRFYLEEGNVLFAQTQELKNTNEFSFTVDSPLLWWPNGFGEQVLYHLDFIIGNEEEEQTVHKRIGIRKIVVDDSLDGRGRNMAVYVNDVKVFIKGSNYVLPDNILSRVTYESTKRLLSLVRDFNQNAIRVWGGSYYPDDYFYDLCDEMGILVFQDMMFACALYDPDDSAFVSLVEEETRHTIRRIKNHPCLFAFSGNNEIEISIENRNNQGNERDKINYMRFFHDFLKRVVKEEIDIFYLSSSPTSGAPYFERSMDPNYLDVHDWSVWHGRQPFEYFKTIYPRFLSEFGTQSFPTMDTIHQYAADEDLSIDSEVIEHHQKSKGNNPLIMRYITDLYPEPKSFEDMVYLSMLSQAEGIKICAEHLRRHKDICNGMIYWQLNDAWPGQTWSSIDYCFGIKALHYYSRKFYAPHLISVDDEEKGLLKIAVSNDSKDDMRYVVKYGLYDFAGHCLSQEELKCDVLRTSNKNAVELKDPFTSDDQVLYAQLFDWDGNLLSDAFYQRKKDKELHYPAPHLSVRKIDDCHLAIKTGCFAKGIYIEPHDNRCVLSDNYFNLLPGQEAIVSSTAKLDFSKLEIRCLNDLCR